VTDLFEAKALVLAAFARGPAIMLEERDRDKRLVSLLTVVEMEWESTQRDERHERQSSTVTSIHVKGTVASVGPVVDASRGKVNWTRIFADLRSRPGSQIEVLYDKMRTAVVRASYIEQHNDDLVAVAEHRGDRAVVILAVVV